MTIESGTVKQNVEVALETGLMLSLSTGSWKGIGMTNLSFFSLRDQPVSLELLIQNDLDQYCHLETI